MTLSQHTISDGSEPLFVYERPEWHTRAACRGKGPEKFYADGTVGAIQVVRDSIARFCRDCPVRLQCAEAGVTEINGVWGGIHHHRIARVSA